MNKDDLLSDEFLKQFKTGEELTSFLKNIQKRGIEKMLEGELDAHLDYGKHNNLTILTHITVILPKRLKPH